MKYLLLFFTLFLTGCSVEFGPDSYSNDESVSILVDSINRNAYRCVWFNDEENLVYLVTFNDEVTVIKPGYRLLKYKGGKGETADGSEIRVKLLIEKYKKENKNGI